jgi:acetyl-CoA carboxylase biotin carboxyl carrier protein
MPQPRIDSDAIRQLAQLLEETGLTEVELKEGDRSIRVVRNGVVHAAVPAPLPAAPEAATASSGVEDSHAGAVTSPMVGTIYLAPGPGEPPFVTVGMQVAEGATLFIVEAMKVMNPILAPRAGTVTRILVSDAQPVEFGEPLLILE